MGTNFFDPEFTPLAHLLGFASFSQSLIRFKEAVEDWSIGGG